MRNTSSCSLIALLAALVGAPGATHAQAKCLEGRTATGQCINPGLANALQQNAIIFSQSKISQTHYPVLPSDDRKYRYPNELNPDQLKPSAASAPPPPPPSP
jgi:hypothetical protein